MQHLALWKIEEAQGTSRVGVHHSQLLILNPLSAMACFLKISPT